MSLTLHIKPMSRAELLEMSMSNVNYDFGAPFRDWSLSAGRGGGGYKWGN